MTIDRTPQDFALEFAEYMAKGAEKMLEAINARDEALCTLNELDEDDHEFYAADQAHCEAIDLCSEYASALRNDIYEFRKRRDRAAASIGKEKTE